MGCVVLQDGTTKWDERVSGTVAVSALLRDIDCPEYTISYRLHCATIAIKCVGLGKILPILHMMRCTAEEKPFVVKLMADLSVNFTVQPDVLANCTADLERKLNMSLAELELSVRATNCLESEGITTVRDLVNRSDEELLEVRNFGETTLKEVKQKLEGLNLGPFRMRY